MVEASGSASAPKAPVSTRATASPENPVIMAETAFIAVR